MSNSNTESKIFLIIFLASLTAFGPFVTDFYLPALPQQGEDLQASSAWVQAGISTSLWGLALGQLIIGPLSDRKGRKIPLFISLGVFCIGTIGCIFTPNIEFFVLCRFVQGLGAAGGIVLAKSIATDKYKNRELSNFLSLIGAVQGLAPIIAPICGAILVAYLGWREIFGVLLLLGVVLIFATARFQESLASYRRVKGKASFLESFKLFKSDSVFTLLVLQQSAGCGVLFAYIASSAFLFQTMFSLTPIEYSIVFALNAIMISIGTFTCRLFKSMMYAVIFGSIGMLASSVALGIVLLSMDSVIWVELCLMCMTCSLGMTFPSGTGLALNRQRDRAGSASALLGALGFAVGGLVAPLAGIGEHGMGLVIVSGAMSVLGLAFALLATNLTRNHDAN